MTNVSAPSSRQKLSAISALLSRLFFAVTLVLIPVRLRMVLLARPQPTLYRDYTDYLLFAADVALLLTLAFWGGSLLLSPRRIHLGPRHVWIPLAVLTFVGCLSAATSVDPALSGYHGIRLIALFWFYVFIINEIRNLAWVVVPVVVQASIQSIVAVAQFIAQRSVDLQSVGELYLNPAWSGISIVIANDVRLLRAYGLTDNPNILGGSLAFAAVLLLAASQRTRSRMTALACLLPPLLVTFSRSAWLAFLGGAAFLLGVVVLRRHWQSLGAWFSFALTGVFVMMPFFFAYARFFGARLNADHSFAAPSVEQQAIGERILLLDSAAPLLLSHPLLGVGLGASPLALRLAYPDFPVATEPPHFTLADAALETGTLGAVSYLALVLGPFVIFFRQRHSLLGNPVACASIALLLSIGIVGLFDYYTWLLVPGRLWQWLAWGLWGSASRGTLQASLD